MVTLISNSELMKRIPILAKLSSAQSLLLSRHMQKPSYKKGQLIIRQGELVDLVYIVVSGWVKMQKIRLDGGESYLAILRSGDFFGGLNGAGGAPYPVTVRAETQVNLICFRSSDFTGVLLENKEMTLGVLEGIIKRLRCAERRIESFSCMDVSGRVLCALIDVAETPVDGTRFIPAKLSQSDISKFVGASREMVGRVMKDLEQKGYIEKISKDQIMIDYDLVCKLPHISEHIKDRVYDGGICV